MGVSRKKADKFSADVLMLKTASALVRDFQANLNDTSFCCNHLVDLDLGDVASARKSVPAPDQEMDVAYFKATYQVQSVLKRYRFRKDIYSEEELTDKAVQAYLDTQTRLSALDLDSLPLHSQRILDLAASYIAETLGVYNDEECRSLCRFGNGASVGIPARKASLAERWQIPISGSLEQIGWFEEEISQICCIQEYLEKQQKDSETGLGQLSIYQPTSSLTLSLVPKTFKSLRAIMPNTTIGSYMSDGIGKIMRKRLKRVGYDIRTLQMRHRVLAREASIHSLYTTADLSSASDSISVALVERLFPSDWVDILTRSRIGTVTLPGGQSVKSLTFCTMGIGYTFPLQTLVFLSLLKAIQSYYFGWNDRRAISVYGDDLIYASRMHHLVAYHFEQFGFLINVDKTFSEGHFRESCGGDYYHGVDVRPFQPRNGAAFVGKHTYEAMLYKFVNTLLARWSEYEIGGTLKFLCSEIVRTVGKIKTVPCNYPDDSGIKCPSLTFWDFLERAHCASLKCMGSGVYRFSFLRFVPDEREEVRHEPYLWARLRGGDDYVDYYHRDRRHQELPSPIAQFINTELGIREDGNPLQTRVVKPIRFIRGFTGKRLRRTKTVVTISHTGRYQRQSGFSCFEDRRTDA